MTTWIDRVAIAYAAGKASRSLRRSYDSNPYPAESGLFAEKRAAWHRGWIERDAEIAFRKEFGDDTRDI